MELSNAHLVRKIRVTLSMVTLTPELYVESPLATYALLCSVYVPSGTVAVFHTSNHP